MSNLQSGQFLTEAIHIVNQEGESLDISGIIKNFSLYESIYKKFSTAEISFIDGLNILKNYRFTGQEFIRISIKQREGTTDDELSSKEFSIDKTFRIFKAGYVERPKEMVQTYVLNLCDPRMFYATRTRISRTLRGAYSDMLGEVLMNDCHIRKDEFDQWEDSIPPNQQFIMPNWTVSKFIDFVCNNANIGPQASYKNGMFFFQTLNGGFRFKSIDTMCGEEFPIPFTYKPVNAHPTDDLDINAPGGLNSQIMQVSKPQLFDSLQGTIGGAYASSAKVYDPVKKIEEDVLYDMEETFGRSPLHVSGFPMTRTGKMLAQEQERVLTTDNMIDAFTSPAVTELDVDLPPNKSKDAVVIYDYTTNHDFDDSADITTDSVFQGQTFKTNARLERRALLEILQQHRIKITIPLRTDISVGTIVKLNIPEPESQADPSSSTKDTVNDNRYLITDMKITGSPLTKSGIINLECVKESYAKDISKATPLKTASGGSEFK